MKEKIKALKALILECDMELSLSVFKDIFYMQTRQMRMDAINQLKELTKEDVL